MKIPSRRKPSYRLIQRSIAAAAVSLCFTQGANALSFDPSDDLQIDWDTTLTYGAGWRVENQDDALINPAKISSNATGNVNADDGNRNFSKGLMSNRLSVTTEMDLNYKRSYGAFVRARAYYDDVYHSSTDNDAPGDAFFNGLSHNSNEFADATRKRHGDEAEILDYFVYGNFDVAGKSLNVRLGSQVVSWGESVFVVGGISTAQSPLDATQLGVAGVELKDIFLPVEQLYAQLELNDALSVEAYYQYKWDKTRLVGAGSYFSADDFFDEGGESLILAPGVALGRGADTRADDDGQYGIALRYLAEDLNNTEFGFYYLNYHDKLPFFDLSKAATAGTYALQYAEDIKLYGVSFGTVLGDTNVSGEYSYRDGMILFDPNNLGIEADVSTLQLSAIHIFGPSFLADDTTFVGEVGYHKVHDLDSTELASGDTEGWGFAGKVNLAYQQIVPGIDMNIPIVWNHDLAGNLGGDSAVLATFDKGKDVVSIGAEFIYLNNFKTDITYTAFLGDADDHPLSDRDYISISAKYSF